MLRNWGLLRGKHIRPFGHGRPDGVGLGEQVEAAIGGLLEHGSAAARRIHGRGLDVEHGRALCLGGCGIAGFVGVDPACRLEDVGYHRAGQHRLHVNVVVMSGRLNVEMQALGQRQHRVLAHDVGRLQAESPRPPPTDDRFHTHAGSSVAIILGRNARTP